jgi:hypothetical protein
MPDVIGESFDSYVLNQIRERQSFLRRRNEYDNDFHRYTSRYPFIRLTSGITVDKGVCERIGFNGDSQIASCVGDNLAKNFILFSSFFQNPNTSVDNILLQNKEGQYTSKFSSTAGVGYGYGLLSNPPSQGFLSSPEFGYTPPPGIESVTIKTLNKGTLKEATINITAHNLIQFRVIEALFLKLRYSLLLEWGHSSYIESNPADTNYAKVINLGQDYDLYRRFLSSPGSQKEMYTEIERLRQKSGGNYDAFLGVVKNFNWNLKSNGTYDINVIAISMGDVIESLKVNSYFNSSRTSSDLNSFYPPQYQKSTLHMYCRELQLKTEFNSGKPIKDNDTDGFNTSNKTIASSLGILESFSNDLLHGRAEAIRIPFPNLGESMFYSTSDPGNARQFAQFYITLEALLRFIEAFMLEYDSKHSNEPIFRINHSQNTNKFLTLPLQISSNPSVCLIPPNPNILNLGGNLKTEFEKRSYSEDLIMQYQDNGGYFNVFNDFVLPGGYSGASPKGEVVAEVIIPNGQIEDQWYIESIVLTATDNSTSVTIEPASGPIPVPFVLYKEVDDSEGKGYGPGGFYNAGSTHKLGKYDSILGLVNVNGDSLTAGDRNSVLYNYKKVVSDILDGKYTTAPGWRYSSANAELDSLTLNNTTGKIKITVNTFVHTKISDDTNKFALGSDVINSLPFQYVKSPSETLDPPFRFDDYTARTMSILVNLEHIINTVDSNLNKDGEVDVLNFLKNLMDDIGQALGGINDFELSYDDIDNTYRIIDNTYIANSNNKSHPTLQINTLTDTKGTFVQDVSIKTELTSRIANAIAAGAQSNGNTGVSNGTTFAKFNNGLTDRIITNKQNANNDGTKDSAYTSQALRANELIAFVQKHYKALGPEVTKEDCQKFGGIAKDLYQYQLGYLTNTNEVAGTMFIPLNLQLTVDGISGLKQYQSFSTNQDLLPLDYQNRLSFVIKGLNHKINDKGWSTTIETLAINKKTQSTEKPNYQAADIKYEPPKKKVKEDNLSPIDTSTVDDTDLWMYLAWNQGVAGAIEHYKISRGEMAAYDQVKLEYIVNGPIKGNWPGKRVASNGVTRADVATLFYSDPKKLAIAFIDVQKQNYAYKTQTGAALINSDYVDIDGVSYPEMKKAIEKAVQNNPGSGITFDNVVNFAMIENSLQLQDGRGTPYRGMFQMGNYRTYDAFFAKYPPKPSLKVTKDSEGNNVYYDTFGKEDMVGFFTDAIPLISKNLKAFIAATGFPN